MDPRNYNMTPAAQVQRRDYSKASITEEGEIRAVRESPKQVDIIVNNSAVATEIMGQLVDRLEMALYRLATIGGSPNGAPDEPPAGTLNLIVWNQARMSSLMSRASAALDTLEAYI